MFLFSSSPAHKGLHGAGSAGSETLAELIKTYNPRLVVIAQEGATEMLIGKSLVVSPGRLDRDQYALVDLHDLAVEIADATAQTRG